METANGFFVAGIAALHLPHPFTQENGIGSPVLEYIGLVADFRLDCLLPELFLERFAGFNLGTVSLALQGMAFQVQQQAGRHHALVAGNHRHIVLHQVVEQGMADADLPVFEQYTAQVFHRSCFVRQIFLSLDPAVLRYQLPFAQAQVAGSGDIEGAGNHKMSLPINSQVPNSINI